MKKFQLFLALCAALSASAAPKRVALIAGPLDDHPPGTHEYENTVLTLKHALESSTNMGPLQIETHFGWPTTAAALNGVDTIVLTSGGSDRNETDHPLYVSDHFAQLEQQIKRGCGLVMLHWSTFHPKRHHEKITEWLGGYFDYETGTNGPTKRWFSRIEHATWPVVPAQTVHPLLRGIQPFGLKDEFYFNIRFRENDPRVTPILFKQTAQKENIIAWAVERNDGGRGFGFTAGHFYTNWWQPDFRKLMLNAIVWTAKLDVPQNGIDSSLEKFHAPLSRKEKEPAPVPSSSKKIKPPTAATDSGAVAKEESWQDNRWNQMNTGRFLASIVPTPNGTIAKGLSIRLGESEDAAVVYDTALCNLRAAWTGKFLAFHPARFGLINSPSIAGETQFLSPPTNGWNKPPQYTGLFLNGNRVVLSYRVGDVPVLESPWIESIGETKLFTRTFQLEASETSQILSLAESKGAKAETNEIDGIQIISLEMEGSRLVAAVKGNALLRAQNDQIILEFPSREKTSSCKVFMSNVPDLNHFDQAVKNSGAIENLAALTQPGSPRWGDAIAVKGQPALPSNDAYVLDTITVPYENPYKALMFLSGVDFFSGGDAAVSTIHGDVWRVSGIDDQLRDVRWKRFATGLFQPLGLKIVDDKIYVLGRDQITVLHDNNRDGEAEHYENFCNQINTSTGGHDYVTSLEVDSNGNFYYVDPKGLHRVSRDGQQHETIATGFRNPNGMGVGPDGVITVAPQEGNWTPSSAICEIKPGGYYGFGGPKFSSDRPLGYDAPLCWIPRNSDNSTASQIWTASERWGPLQNQLLNFSFGRCAMMLVLREVVDGTAQGGVVSLKPRFLSGAMRGAMRRQDGQLYVVGSLGWSTSASREGSFQRVRYTGRNAYLPTALHVRANGIELGFSDPLERETAEDSGSYAIEQWNYLYSKNYGSKEYSVAFPNEVGHDEVEIKSARLLADGRSVFLEIPDLKPVMQMEIQFNLNAADGKTVRGEIYNTIHRLGTAKTF